MKKGFPILFTLLMLATILHLSLATHYCDGKEVATKVSFSGKLASCKNDCLESELPVTGENFTKHCCDDVLMICGIANYYEPTFSFVPESHHYNFQFIALHNGLSVRLFKDLVTFSSNVNLSGVLTFTDPDLSDICVFRI